MIHRLLLLVLVLMLGFSSCRKEQNQDGIPYYPFRVELNLDLPEFIDLAAPGGWVYYRGVGSKGIIIYRYSLDEFKVYERHSPYNVSAACVLRVAADGITVEDPCSESTWVIFDGSISSGPAVRPLHEYYSVFSNPVLIISN